MPRRQISRIVFAALVAAVLTLALAGAAAAQLPVRIDSMSIALWPEYDKAGVLVIYRGALTSDTKLPARLTFAIPRAAGKPSSTAGVDAQGNFRYLKYEIVEQGDQLLVSYDCPYAGFQFEYYYDPLQGQGPDRKFDYTYRADYAIADLSFEVQEPAGASGLSTMPAGSDAGAREGFNYRSIQVGPLQAGQSTTVSVSYRKTDTRLSSEIKGLPTPSNVQFEDVPKPAAGGVSTSTLIIISATLVAIAAVVGLTVWMNNRNRRSAPMSVPAQRGARANRQRGRAGAMPAQPLRPAAKPPAPSAGITGYCHNCGRGLKADEIFCPACGTRRKGA
jgi:hypothetical protein